MPHPLPLVPDPAPPPPNLDAAGGDDPVARQAAHDAARDQQWDQVRTEAVNTEEPRGEAARQADRWLAASRAYLRQVVGYAPWVQGVYPCRVLSVDDRTARRCTVQLLESGAVIDNVQADPTNPTVGAEYAARRTVRLNPAATRGAPEEVHWTLKAPSDLWLYWIALPPTQDPASVGTLYRTAWPLADPPVLEALATFPYPQGLSHAADITQLALLGVDGEGTVYAVAQPGGPDRILSRTDQGAGPLVTHALPAGVDPVGTGTGTGFWTAKALATRPGAPGVLLATRPTIALAVDPIGEAFPYTADYTYLRSNDRGATWTPLFSLQAGAVTFEVAGDVVIGIHTFGYHSPAGAAFAWLAADSTEATGLGVGVGDLAYVIAGINERGVDIDATPHPWLIDWELLAAGVPDVFATVNEDQFPNGALLGAGIRADGTWAVYRYDAGAAPPFAYRASTHGPAGPWTSPTGTPGAGAFLRAFAQDRTFTHALWLDNETTGVLTTDGGATWTGLTAGQGALLASVLTTDHHTGFWGGGVIVESS